MDNTPMDNTGLFASLIAPLPDLVREAKEEKPIVGADLVREAKEEKPIVGAQ